MDNMFSVASRVSLKVVPASHLFLSITHTRNVDRFLKVVSDIKLNHTVKYNHNLPVLK